MSDEEAEDLQEEVQQTPTNETGVGKFQFPDGSLYEGEWMKVQGLRRRHGKGKFTDGADVYEGEWENDALHGSECIVTLSGGAEYRGDMQNHMYHGLGRYIWSDGATYEGGWANNKMHGEGTYTGPDGVKWSGEFRNGSFNNGRAWVVLR